jgi:hypothetical protein
LISLVQNTGNIFECEEEWLNGTNELEESAHKTVSRVGLVPVTDLAKTLAWGTTNHSANLIAFAATDRKYVRRRHLKQIGLEGKRLWKIVLVT